MKLNREHDFKTVGGDGGGAVNSVLHKVEGQENWNNMPIYANSPGLTGSLLDRASDISRCRRAAKFRYPWNPAKFGKNLIKYMSVQHIWNLFQLLGLFTCCKRANLSWKFVTETCKQPPETTRHDYAAKNWALAMIFEGFANWFISWVYCCWKSKW